MASNTSQPQPPPLLNLPAHHRASLASYLPNHSSPPPTLPGPSPPPPKPSTPSKPPPLPHLTLTYATSLDSAIALGPGLQTALSGPETKAMTHYLRSQHDAILVGANTAIVDDPSLNCRHVAAENLQGEGRQAAQPIPMILDPSARWGAPEGSKVLRLAREGRGRGVLWVVGGDGDVDDGAARRVKGAGGDVLVFGKELRCADGGVDWGVLLEALAGRGVSSVMVEGGAKVIVDLLKKRNQRFVSSVVVTIAPVWLGEGGVMVYPRRGETEREAGRLEEVRWLPMGEDVVMAGRFGDSGR